jgi:hypothetical protein
MDYRNAVYNALGSIDCEINHPTYGWIPFTADPNDFEPLGSEIFNAAKSGATPYVPTPPAPPTKAEQESRRQSAYTQEADPLFFKWQAGEGTEAEWLAKREEIRNRFPYPTDAPN